MNFNSRKIIAAVLCAAILFALCACGAKTTTSREVVPDKGLTVSKYEAKAEEFGLTVPIMNSVVSAGALDSSIVVKADGSKILWQAEYYIFDSEETAKATFEANMKNFQTDDNKGTLSERDDKVTFESVEGGHYRYLSRIGSTFLYFDVNEQYADDVKAFVKTLGY